MLLLSIRPEFARSILAGVKRVEFRRRMPRQAGGGSQLAIYASTPTCALVGLATIEEIVETTPNALWRRYKDVGGIEHQDFISYYEGADNAVGLVLTDVRSFKHPPALSQLREKWGRFHPPQQFAYLSKDRRRRVRKLKCQ